MSSSRLFVSSFLIGLGAVLLLGRLGVTPLPWLLIIRFWPVILVLLGLWVLDRRKKLGNVPVILVGLVVAVLFGALIDRVFSGEWNPRPRSEEAEEFSRPFGDSTNRGIFRLEAGAGTFSIGGSTTDLVSAKVRSSTGHYLFRSDRIERSEDISLIQQGRHRLWMFSRTANRVSVNLNPAIPWDVHIDVGASRLELDLAPCQVERVEVECGVSQIRLRLGERSVDTRCLIKGGASSITILVPSASACEIDADAPLSHTSFSGFETTDEGTYRTENYFTAEHKIFITLEAGISNVKVLRY